MPPGEPHAARQALPFLGMMKTAGRFLGDAPNGLEGCPFLISALSLSFTATQLIERRRP